MGLIADISPVDPEEIVRVFTHVSRDLSVVVSVDDVEANEQEFLVRTHDLYGTLPEIRIPQLRTRQGTIDQARREATDLYAVAGLRNTLRELMPECHFVPPTTTKQGVVVGILPGNLDTAILAEGESFIHAYQALLRKCRSRTLHARHFF